MKSFFMFFLIPFVAGIILLLTEHFWAGEDKHPTFGKNQFFVESLIKATNGTIIESGCIEGELYYITRIPDADDTYEIVQDALDRACKGNTVELHKAWAWYMKGHTFYCVLSEKKQMFIITYNTKYSTLTYMTLKGATCLTDN